MNWNIGFYRLYLILTLVWFLLFPMHWAWYETYDTGSVSAADFFWEFLFDGFERAVYIWLAISLAWMSVRWLIRGFKTVSQPLRTLELHEVIKHAIKNET